MNLSLEKLTGRYAESKKLLFEIDKVQLSTQLKVSKVADKHWHDREFTNNLVLEDAQLYLSPATLLIYRYVTEVQTIYQNMNFSFYKEYVTRYLNMAVEKRFFDDVDPQTLREAIERTVDSRPHSPVIEYKDLINCKSTFSLKDKETYHNADRDYFDVVMTRVKQLRNLMVVVCNIHEEPLCIVRISNVFNKVIETFPFSMKFQQELKVENILLQQLNCQTEKDLVIGHIDEFSTNESYNVWNDFQNYHLRNLDLQLSTELFSKLIKFAMKFKEQLDGLRIRNSKWIPRRKILRENASYKKDFLLKVNVSSIQVQIQSESGDQCIISLASCNKDPLDNIKSVVDMLEVSNIKIQFRSAKCNFDQDQLVTLLSLPKVVIKKNFTLKNSPV